MLVWLQRDEAMCGCCSPSVVGSESNKYQKTKHHKSKHSLTENSLLPGSEAMVLQKTERPNECGDPPCSYSKSPDMNSASMADLRACLQLLCFHLLAHAVRRHKTLTLARAPPENIPFLAARYSYPVRVTERTTLGETQRMPRGFHSRSSQSLLSARILAISDG